MVAEKKHELTQDIVLEMVFGQDLYIFKESFEGAATFRELVDMMLSDSFPVVKDGKYYKISTLGFSVHEDTFEYHYNVIS